MNKPNLIYNLFLFLYALLGVWIGLEYGKELFLSYLLILPVVLLLAFSVYKIFFAKY